MKKGLLLCFLALLVACNDKSTSSKPAKNPIAAARQQQRQQVKALQKRELKMAVMMMKSNVGNIQNGGGYQMWTASKMADTLLRLSNSAGSARRSSPLGEEHDRVANVGTVRPNITYTKDRVSKPWQIVLIPDDNAKRITIKAYAEDTKKPLFTDSVKVSTY